LDKHKLKLIIDPAFIAPVVFVFLISFIYFIFFVIILSSTNSTIGKKLSGIEIQGENQYSISITKTFLREFIFKPLSILSVVGIIYFFLDSKKRTLHDILSSTIVVKTKLFNN
jgi:uncharacterized RDD family membrane protein YckC